MSMIKENLSMRIKELRRQRGLSLQALADKSGCTKTHIWDIERGRSGNPTIELAVSIASALGVSLEYLTGLSSTLPAWHPEALRIAGEIDAALSAQEGR